MRCTPIYSNCKHLVLQSWWYIKHNCQSFVSLDISLFYFRIHKDIRNKLNPRMDGKYLMFTKLIWWFSLMSNWIPLASPFLANNRRPTHCDHKKFVPLPYSGKRLTKILLTGLQNLPSLQHWRSVMFSQTGIWHTDHRLAIRCTWMNL